MGGLDECHSLGRRPGFWISITNVNDIRYIGVSHLFALIWSSMPSCLLRRCSHRQWLHSPAPRERGQSNKAFRTRSGEHEVLYMPSSVQLIRRSKLSHVVAREKLTPICQAHLYPHHYYLPSLDVPGLGIVATTPDAVLSSKVSENVY